MNIQQFRYILSVVDLKNFEAAAEKCFVTQSTLSTMIGRFEDEIGIKIFNRKTKPVSITAEGKLIIDRLRIVVNEIDSLNGVVKELKGELVGELRIGIIPTIAPYILPLFLTKLTEKFPKVKVIVKEMTTPQIQVALKTRTLDIGILAIPLMDPELKEQELYTEPFVIYDCREDRETEIRVSIEELDYSKLWLLQEGHCLRSQVHQICEKSNKRHKQKTNFEFESASMGSLLRFTKANQGLTILPYLAMLDLDEEEKKKIVRFENPIPVRSVGIVTHEFFAKKNMLKTIEELIKQAVIPILPKEQKNIIINPLD